MVPLRNVTIDGTLLYLPSMIIHLERSTIQSTNGLCCIFKKDCCITYIFMRSVEFFQMFKMVVMNTNTRRFQRLSLIYV